jgi:two-component system, NarL family, sensor histidine kinase UhpB
MDDHSTEHGFPAHGGQTEPAEASGARGLYRHLFRFYPDAVLVEDQQGRIIECNEAACKIFGYTRREMLTLTIRDLIPRSLAVAIPDLIDEEDTTHGVLVWVSSRKKDGTIFPTQYSSRLIPAGKGKQVLAIFRDVSDQYYYRRPVPREKPSGIYHAHQDFPNFNLTWEFREGEAILIGYDNRSGEITRNLVSKFLGEKARDLYKERKDIVADLEQCFQERSILRRKTLYRMFTTGEERIAEITYTFVHPNIVIMNLEDYTERDSAEALHRSFVRSSPVGLCLIQGGELRFANPKLHEYTGYDEGELSRLEPTAIVHPEDWHLIEELLDQDRPPEAPSLPVELRIIRKDGEVRWMMVTFTSIFYLGGQALLLNLADITDLKGAREKLDELTRLQSSIMAAIPHAVIGIENGRIVFSNHAVETVFGWRPREIAGKTMGLFFRDRNAYKREARKLYQQLMENEAFSFEYTYKRKDGSDVICLTSISRISENEYDRRIVSTHTDITEKKRAEESLRESQRVLTTLMGNLPGMAYRSKNDPDWTMEFVSEGSYALTGYRPSDLVDNATLSYGDLIHPDDRDDVWDSVQDAVANHDRYQLTYRIITSEGRVKWVWEKGQGVFSSDGEFQALEGFISDITERKLAEEQLKRSRRQLRIHAEHLDTVLEGERAEIAREIHDELGQILTALKMDLFWVERKMPPDRAEIQEKVHSMISHIDSTIKTVERILMDLRPGMLEDLGLNPAIEWQTEEFQRRTGITCDAILDPDPEKLISDAKLSTALFRICQETLTNIARHSQATKAEIHLRLASTYVELKVRDNGKGITRNDIRKPGSFGILGIRERTSLLGGRMTIGGRSSKGTVVRVRIPLSQNRIP